eukprot:TRINITY_DN95587_c0_g1_i1.p1 TRINITY_DN95587_c0_g1~~TRINITY_DN95587_c0_g1_i1.p1  ORF type:complete len:670 (+),score=249.30 TRINITY_DN95587_c0_g1_i1:71-2080(+)
MKNVLKLSLVAAASGSLTFDAAETGGKPVAKVVRLLKGMQKQLEDEKKEDEKIYKRLSCWCKGGRKDKKAAVDESRVKIAELQGSADELKAGILGLESELTSLKAQAKDAETAIREAEDLRMKQYKKFKDSDQSVQTDIIAVENAYTTLTGGKESLLQMSHKESLDKLAIAVKRAMDRHPGTSEEALTFAAQDKMHEFLSDPKHFLNQRMALLQTGTEDESSGEPATTFKIMADDFKKERAAGQEQEEIDAKTSKELISAKKVELAAATKSLENKRTAKAAKKDKLFKAEVQIKDLTKSVAADEDFLQMLEKKCGAGDTEFQARQDARADEIEAVGKAIDVLDDEDAYNTFSKTLSLLQVEESSSDQLRREKFRKALSGKSNDRRIKALIETARINSFTKVKKAIDDMVVALKKESQDEVEKKDFCKKAFGKNDRETASLKEQAGSLGAEVEQIGTTLSGIATKVSELEGTIAESEKAMKEATATRQQEEKDFKQTIIDQKTTLSLLKKAMDVLSKTYGFIQRSTQPEGFGGDYKQNAGGFKVMSLMQQIIADTKALEAEATRDEEEATADYKRLIEKTEASIKAQYEELSSQHSERASSKQNLLTAQQSLEGASAELANLATEAADLHESCDFLLKNFDLRQKARADEVESLKTAKAVLSGSAGFLQK